MRLTHLAKRLERLEQQRSPARDIPPFHIIDPSRQTQAEIAAIRAEVDEYERRNPDGIPAFIVEVAFFSDE